jgi:HTH-type transcriptional regulator, sugar sensing transcriptional regulator
MDTIIERLRTVGFSLYEARLYAALVQHGPQNGNELSRSSGVPSSKVYAAVEKLVAEGSVQSIKSPGGTRFVALQPDELINRLRRRFNDPLDYLAEKLPPLADHVEDEVFLSVSGESSILESARQLISAAREELNISLWEPELEGLRAIIAEAAGRGVRIFGMLDTASADEPEAARLRHSYEEIVGNRVGGRMLTLVADGTEALVARLRDRDGAAGVRTRNPVLTLIVSEYLHHDLVLQRAQIGIGFDEWDRWWQADPDLRGKILGRALERRNDKQTRPRTSVAVEGDSFTRG